MSKSNLFFKYLKNITNFINILLEKNLNKLNFKNLRFLFKNNNYIFLEKKQLELTVNKSNKNDIRKILGNPSTTSKFDNDIWIYIERKQTQSKLKNLIN